MSMLEANLFQKQIDSQPITLRIVRPDKNEEYKIERKLLNADPFSFQAVEGTSGILTIHTFYPPLVDLLQEKMLTPMKAQKESLIVDLRNCHEGEIGEAIQFINLFLQKETIGYFEKKNGIRNNLACPKEAQLSHLPLVIWTNQATMGPAEIVANVLKAEKNARIIGRQTLGLAAKQSLFTLEDGSGALLTSAIFHPASKDKLWLKGVKPDINIKEDKQSKASYLEETQKIILNN
jgi:carboxyl-terminal processing protease